MMKRSFEETEDADTDKPAKKRVKHDTTRDDNETQDIRVSTNDRQVRMQISNLGKNTDFNSIQKKFSKILVGNKNNNKFIYYHYFNKNDLFNVLTQTYFISHLNVCNNLIDIICDYYGITKYCTKNKKGNINIYDSHNNKISYAILTHIEKNNNNISGINGINSVSNSFINEWTHNDYAIDWSLGICTFENPCIIDIENVNNDDSYSNDHANNGNEYSSEKPVYRYIFDLYCPKLTTLGNCVALRIHLIPYNSYSNSNCSNDNNNNNNNSLSMDINCIDCVNMFNQSLCIYFDSWNILKDEGCVYLGEFDNVKLKDEIESDSRYNLSPSWKYYNTLATPHSIDDKSVITMSNTNNTFFMIEIDINKKKLVLVKLYDGDNLSCKNGKNGKNTKTKGTKAVKSPFWWDDTNMLRCSDNRYIEFNIPDLWINKLTSSSCFNIGISADIARNEFKTNNIGFGLIKLNCI